MLWFVAFFAGSGVVVLGGVAVATSGSEIARRIGASQLLVGAFLAALATSLPEVITNASAALADEPELAVGSVFGSSMANMAILAVLDLSYRGRMLTSVELRQARLAAVAIVLTAVAVLGIVYPSDLELGWVGVYPLVIVVLYAITFSWLGSASPTFVGDVGVPPAPRAPLYRRMRTGGIGPATVRYLLGAGAILVAAPIVVRAAEEIADDTGIATGFIGVALIAIATSLPELFTSLGALRIGAYDLAVGNLLGSNSFNVVSLVIADVFFTDGPLMGAVGSIDVVAGLVAIALMATALAAIVVDPEEHRTGPLEPGPVVLLVAYVLGLVGVYTAGA